MDRGANMRAIRSKDMKPEMAVRRLVHGMGYRYRPHRHGLPGRPDMVFPGRKNVIFVHGCFWYSHVPHPIIWTQFVMRLMVEHDPRLACAGLRRPSLATSRCWL